MRPSWAERDEAGRELERRLGIRAERDASLAEHTTMRVGGPADLLATVRDRFTLRGVVRLARSRGWPLTILGRGSNVVVSDDGIRGLVILNRSGGATVDAATGVVVVDSGLPMAKLSTIAAEAGLTGAEFTLAIPGNVGGAVWANAGAHGGEMGQIIRSVTILRADGSEEELPLDALDLSYRSSRFKHEAGRGEVILGATLQLQRGEPDVIRGALEEIRRWRREHQPLGIPSAGSVFRNPPEGESAGALIEAAGLKGRRIGGAEISTMHANWILNRGGARAAEIQELHALCLAEVQRTAGLTLESEIVFLGETPQ
ncbi:MAG: UDP-N-acetylmuramate dehydrogenase [Chloroflexi bacterium]|nr:MAG: UDP-N-acetylmuramate dehydrogenase [Chloroflexota bacterium]